MYCVFVWCDVVLWDEACVVSVRRGVMCVVVVCCVVLVWLGMVWYWSGVGEFDVI